MQGEVLTTDCHREAILRKFRTKVAPNPALNRSLVSFQANRKTPIYNWFKYKEGFSAEMVQYLICQVTKKPGVLLDPFAGAGTALFAARPLGWETIGIEILPVGFYVGNARLMGERVKIDRFEQEYEKASNRVDWQQFFDPAFAYKHVPITQQAFPKKTERAISGYLAYCAKQVKDPSVRKLMEFGCMSILECVSYTRKDGQYLRWDSRSGKAVQAGFDKGKILSFPQAISQKLKSICRDIKDSRCTAKTLFTESNLPRKPVLDLRLGSCLELLPEFQGDAVDLILTSPPYCNRYDYTRTYALELVFLGYDNAAIKNLRQSMLSCTVENHDKVSSLHRRYDQIHRTDAFDKVNGVFNQLKALHEVLQILDGFRCSDRLNNSNIPRMVRNYFFEMCFAIFEFSRVLRKGGKVIMVNDNVRYAGEEVPVDLILSEMAEAFGLTTKHIWTLPRGKGNSSQQMGNHGRSELRKCVYVWEK